MNDKKKIISGRNVRDYMTSPIPFVSDNSSLQEVAEFMSSHKTSVVLVKNKTHDYIGVVTNADFTRRVAAKEYSVNTATIDSVMSAPVKTIKGLATMAEARKKCKWLESATLQSQKRENLQGYYLP